jgi:SagB-type dehydrogenase family enzyme
MSSNRVHATDNTVTATFVQPHRKGSISLERCLLLRRSVRGFRDQALNQDQLGQLLWAAQGVTSADGRRAVPSAGALYPLDLYVVCGMVTSLAAGVYRYVPGGHALRLLAPGKQHEELVDAMHGQEWIATAPVVVCIAAVFERTTMKYGIRGRGYVYLEAGHAAEALMLQAVALDLATTMVGAFSDNDVKRVFHLSGDATPLCLIPIGRPDSV